MDFLTNPQVIAARSVRPDYGPLESPQPAPELPAGSVDTVAAAAIRDLLLAWNLDAPNAGTSRWNPLGELIREGSSVLLKPNWVLHANQSGQTFDCLVTHTTVIEAVLAYVALTKPSRVIIGDSPVQGCDFQALRKAAQLDEMIERNRSAGLNVEIVDFRRTRLEGDQLGNERKHDCRSVDEFILFDLANDSLLEDLSDDAHKFRVTMYNPDLMQRTHAPGKHQYLIAREVIDADIVINLPKLKTHKKAGITGALKNPVGINGNKEYLPHHRLGGSARGGDCYEGGSALKFLAENVYDRANRMDSGSLQHFVAKAAESLVRAAAAMGDNHNIEGSWYGNDTVWRTSLDLQRIMHYGAADATLKRDPQRTVITITDAIIGGEKDGPLAPHPVLSGFVTGAVNVAAAEWVHARLMGLDPERIAIVRESVGAFKYPLASFTSSDIRLHIDGVSLPVEAIFPLGTAWVAPSGWQGHCELRTAVSA